MSKNTTKFKNILKWALPTIIITAVIFIIYRILLNNFRFDAVLTVYMALTTALLVVYLVYNRGFSRKGVTEEMLPPEWSEEKKRDFVDSAKQRFNRSRWLLLIIASLFLVFVIDAIDIIILPIIKGALGS
jgi:hypothetical protein